jgi:thiosulfate/3-mercaptopyruvate sulfurtransferase
MEPLISAEQLAKQIAGTIVLDCRFSLADPEQGRQQYLTGHIPGARYIHLDEQLSAPAADRGDHGGRHPLPVPQKFCDYLSSIGITRDTPVVTYDDSRFSFASRAWWMMKALDFSNVQVLDGGLQAWQAMGGEMSDSVPEPVLVKAHQAQGYSGVVDFVGVRSAQQENVLLIDSREQLRYEGLEEPIDPIAGHIPGALNFPWQSVCDEQGLALSEQQQVQRWAELEEEKLVVYCGSGVTACVNLLSLAVAGRNDAQLYAGSWSDWCSHLPDLDD